MNTFSTTRTRAPRARLRRACPPRGRCCRPERELALPSSTRPPAHPCGRRGAAVSGVRRAFATTGRPEPTPAWLEPNRHRLGAAAAAFRRCVPGIALTGRRRAARTPPHSLASPAQACAEPAVLGHSPGACLLCIWCRHASAKLVPSTQAAKIDDFAATATSHRRSLAPVRLMPVGLPHRHGEATRCRPS